MPRAFRVLPPGLLSLSLLLLTGCTPIIEDRIEDGPAVHCDEHNLRLSRELDLPDCTTVVGERFLAQLEEFIPDTTAVVSFAPVDAPQAVLEAMEVEVTTPGRVTFTIPDLPVPTGTRLRIQIQGKNVLNAFSGHFEVGLQSTLAALSPGGDVNLWFWNGPTTSPHWHGKIPSTRAASGLDELVFSPCGRFLVAGKRTVTDASPTRWAGQIEPVELDVISGLERRPLQRIESSGGVDSLGFLPSSELASAHVVWSRHDLQTGLWRVVTAVFSKPAPSPTVTVGELPVTAVPPRMVSGFESVIVIPRDHIPAWLSGDDTTPPGAFHLISGDLEVRPLTCAEVFGQDAASAHPVEARFMNHPGQGKFILISCALADFSGPSPVFRVSSRPVPWADGGPRLEPVDRVSTVATARLPLGWVLPPRADTQSMRLLEGLSLPDAPEGPLLVDPVGGTGVELEVPALASPVYRSLMVDPDTLLLYVPSGWGEDDSMMPPGQFLITRSATGWQVEQLARDLEHALVWSGDLLVLANTTQMIQSTLSDFAAGMPGALVVSSSCGFLALKPSYR